MNKVKRTLLRRAGMKWAARYFQAETAVHRRWLKLWGLEPYGGNIRQALAVRWYPEPSDDYEDCLACGVHNDMCVYHQGAASLMKWTEKRLADVDARDDLFEEAITYGKQVYVDTDVRRVGDPARNAAFGAIRYLCDHLPGYLFPEA